jgi:xylulokinase
MSKYLVGIDAGTTGGKACVFDTEGNLLGSDYREYPCQYPKQMWVEQLAGDMVPALFAATKSAVNKAGIDPKDIQAISFSTQGSTFGLVDKDGNLLRPFLVWQDLRGESEVDFIYSKITKKEYYKHTGDPVTLLFASTKILWLMHNEPEIYAKTAKIVDHQTYFMRAFGANGYVTDSSSASRFGIFDVDNEKWDPYMLNLLGIKEDKLATIVQPGTVSGHVTKEVAEQTGLIEGTPICVGAMDCTASTFGSGGTDDGMSIVIMGTYGACFSISDKPIRDPNVNMFVKNNSGLGNFTIEAASNTSASSYRWYRDVFCDNEKFAAGLVNSDAYELINMQIASVPPGADGITFLPYLQGRSGEKVNEKARGSFIGMKLGTRKPAMARAVMEGISYETYDTINAHAATGIKITSVRLTGGAAKSPMWCQMLADIFKMPVQILDVAETGCLGAAMYAGVGSGVYKNCREAAKQVVRLGATYQPNTDTYAAYDEAYKRYNSYYEAMVAGKVW